MEAVPRMSMICCDLKVSPSSTEFGPVLKKYIRDHYHEDPDSYSKEIKELETLRQNAIKAPMDFTGCSLLKKYFSQLKKLQSRFPMTDDGAACVPFMWTDIYSGVAYNITDIEYEEACILYNIGALHSKLGTMDSRINSDGIKVACTHFQCAAYAFQHLRDTYPQPKGSDMSHDLLTFFINVMLAQAQECILEKSMLDNRKSSITAKIAAQVVDYYKCALGIMVSGSPSTDTGSILDIVGSKMYKGWKKFIEFKMAYYTSISHLYMGNQAEENEKWGERVAWFQSAYDNLMEAFKIAKKIDRDDLNDALTFTNDVIGGKHSSSKKENDFVYHDKVPVLSSLPELKGASLVKGIPFDPADPDVSGPDIFARLVPMEAHETSSLYSEEKAKILRTVVAKIEAKNEELMAYLSSLQLESATSFDDEDKIPQVLIEKCAALSVRPTAIADLTSAMNDLLDVSKDVETSLKTSVVLLAEDDKKELRHQESFGKRGPSMITVELKKECSKYEEAHKKAIESNNTLQTAVSIHIGNLSKLSASLDQIAESLPSACSIKNPENVKIMNEFNHLVTKVDDMRKQRQFLENQLRDALMKDDITKRLVTMDKKDNVQQTFAEELKKHNETLTYIDQNLNAQDNILCALTEANARYADTRTALTEIRLKRDETIKSLINSYDAYEDLMEKAKKGLEFYKKLQSNVTRLLSRIKSVTNVQDEERTQRTEAELRKGGRMPAIPNAPEGQHVPKLKDYLPYLNKRGGAVMPPAASCNVYPNLQPNSPIPQVPYVPEPVRQATLGGPSSADFDRSLKPSPTDIVRPDENLDVSSMGIRPTPVGSEQTSVPAMCTSALPNVGVPPTNLYTDPQQPWGSMSSIPQNAMQGSMIADQHATHNLRHQPVSNSSQLPFAPNASTSVYSNVVGNVPQNYKPGTSAPSTLDSSYGNQNYGYAYPNLPVSSTSVAVAPSSSATYPSYGNAAQSAYPNSNIPGSYAYPQTSVHGGVSPSSGIMPNSSEMKLSYSVTPGNVPNSIKPANSIPQHAVYPNGFVSQSSVYSNQSGNIYGSGIHSDSTPQPNSIFSSGPIHQPTSAVQMPSSGQFSTSSAYQNPSNYPGSSTPNSTFPSTVPQGSAAIPQASGVVPSNNYSSTVSYTSLSSGTSSFSTNAIMPGNFNNMPYSTDQQNFIPSGMYHKSQTHSSAYSGVASHYSTGSTTDYVQGPPGALTQAEQACVTASLDTKTNTFNSLNPYAVANSNIAPNLGQNTNYLASSAIKTSNINVPAVAQIQPYSDISKVAQTLANTVVPGASQNGTYGIPPRNISSNNSVPSLQSHGAGSIAYNYNNYSNTFSNNQVHPSYVPDMSSAQNFTNTTPSINSFPSTVTISSNTYMIPSQQNYQAAVSGSDNFSLINAAYGSSPNVSNQQLQAPMEPKSIVPGQTTQSSVNNNQKGSFESQNSVDQTLPKSSSSKDFQGQRDFITPPPDPAISTENDKAKENIPILQPKVIDIKAIAELKEKDSSHLAKDPLDDPSVCAKFVSEVEKYEKIVDGLVRKSLNGTMPLDQKWKEFTDAQDKESRKMSISVARCYPLKNRFPDVMPYDSNRVKLTSAKDDYINASYLKDICPNSPVFIITQSPLPATFSDFWLMVWEQQIETLVCLLSDAELKNHIYFPKERGQVHTFGSYEISLHSYKEKNGFVERMINLTHNKNRTSRVVVHLQFTEWPNSALPSCPAILQFINDTLSYYKQQRNLMRPIVAHCSAGVGRSGCFCMITSMVFEMNNGHGPRDVTQVAATVSHQRKFLIQDKDQLKFCYDTVLYYAQDLLMRRGILTTRATFEDKLPGSASTSSHVRHPSEDFILGGGLAKLQSGIAKLGLSSDSCEIKAPETDIKSSKPDILADDLSSTLGSGDIKLDATATETKPKEQPKSETEVNENSDALKSRKGSADKPLSSITSLLDPSNFTLESSNSPAKRKITKENFATSKGSLSATSSDNTDPLSQLDPLWSLKK